MRECWNWQTGKTKDLGGECSCGFKSHLPHDAEVAELADAHGSGPCGSNTLRVRLPSSALVKEKPYGFLFLKKRLAITCDTRQVRAFLKRMNFQNS